MPSLPSSPFKHDNKFNRIKNEIASDLTRIHDLCGSGDEYLNKQSMYCLRVPQSDAYLKRDIKLLRNMFNGESRVQPTWSFNGHKLGPSIMFFFAFAYSPINGSNGDVIRIEQKAFTLPDKILSGVILHEATHFVLGTVDHVYNWPYNKFNKSTEVYENADNWRIFYQRMRTYLRG